ncbi:Nucleoporin Ndc1 [Dufourea novaeangliae]|uniref:Nucleoporin Ndc1 n=1 Tax=Dufourea novaeangliae TaxID=178035 RepID=A0A154NY19_DUFNO|nr:Nucleoporin Ndc1 [Dufourea novaeangliae]
MMRTTRKGCKELLMQRMFLAIISSIIVQFFLISSLLLVMNLNTNYGSWFQNTWTTITSLRMWSYFCILATITFFQGIICSKSFSNTPPYMKSRFAKFCGIFTSQNILLCALHIISSGLLVWLHLSVNREWVPFEFKQTNVFNNDDSGITLPEALSMDKIPIMQHLGYLDLVTMAQKEKSRRGILFTLSQPGGHPYNWNCLLEKCTSFVKTFTDDLNQACIRSQEQIQMSVPIPAAITKGSTVRREYVYHMRSLVKEETAVPTQEDEIKKDVENELFIQKFIKTKWNDFLAYLFSKPLIFYIFGEIEGGKVCHILFNGQSIIWAIDAISSLAVLSLDEDSYGIVQKDLPLIINTLLALKQTLDKLHKSNIMTKKHGDEKFIKQIFQSLCAATKRSLYRIAINFEDYIEDVPLEPTAMEHLYNFLAYRE